MARCSWPECTGPCRRCGKDHGGNHEHTCPDCISRESGPAADDGAETFVREDVEVLYLALVILSATEYRAQAIDAVPRAANEFLARSSNS